MAKKWKLGKKYKLKDVAGFIDVNSVNEQISDFLEDQVFEIVNKYAENGFFLVKINGEQAELPFSILSNERKFFKVVREKFVVGGQYALIDRKGFLEAYAGNAEIIEAWDIECAYLITDSYENTVVVCINEKDYHLFHKEIKFFKRID